MTSLYNYTRARRSRLSFHELHELHELDILHGKPSLSNYYNSKVKVWNIPYLVALLHVKGYQISACVLFSSAYVAIEFTAQLYCCTIV